MGHTRANPSGEVDVALIGAGIISSTLSVLLKELEPEWSQAIIEREDAPALESSNAWNNAGTGHSALCELNYTEQTPQGVDISKAVGVNEKFQVSRQLWSYLVEQGVLTSPEAFINPTPHISFAQGKDQVDFLKARYEAMKDHPLFPGMQYSEDPEVFAEKLPLMAEGRDFSTPIAISWFDIGTDINFGALTNQYINSLENNDVEVYYGTEVQNLTREDDLWKITTKSLHTGDISTLRARFVFVGAGGMALPLLQKAGIPEVKGYGGFPVSGQWLRCTNPDVIEQHSAKVYGKASVGAPPMSVPHLDTRIIDGEKGLLFGPYAGWSPKFLKNGSYLDLFKSLRPGNLPAMIGVGLQEFGLTKYLITEVLKNQKARMESLREYMPTAKDEDWEIVEAGQRVQVIKPQSAPKFGSLEFGTAIVNSEDGTIAGLMGASPGASVAPAAMLEVIENCFPDKLMEWNDKLVEMVPSYGQKLADNPELFQQQWNRSQKDLNLDRS